MASSPSLLFKSSHDMGNTGHKLRHSAAAVTPSPAKPEEPDKPQCLRTDAPAIGRHRAPPFYMRWLLALRR